MRKLQLVFAALVLAATATAASAQDAAPQGRGAGRGNPTAMVFQGITLTAEQQVKVDSLTQKYMADMTALRADTTVAQDARRAKGAEMRTKLYDAIKPILTAEQKTVFEKNLADMQARMQGGGRPPQN